MLFCPSPEGTASIAALTLPSCPLIICFTLVSPQNAWGVSSCRKTTSPALTVVAPSPVLPAHCCRCNSLKSSNYSNCHHFQNWFITVLTYLILLVRWSWVGLTSVMHCEFSFHLVSNIYDWTLHHCPSIWSRANLLLNGLWLHGIGCCFWGQKFHLESFFCLHSQVDHGSISLLWGIAEPNEGVGVHFMMDIAQQVPRDTDLLISL